MGNISSPENSTLITSPKSNLRLVLISITIALLIMITMVVYSYLIESKGLTSSSKIATEPSNTSIISSGRIAFLRDEQLWIASSDGTNQQVLTENAIVVDKPIWSPDGTKIVFLSLNPQKRGSYDPVRNKIPYEYFYYDFTDGKIRQIPTPIKSELLFHNSFSWAPDSNRFVYGLGKQIIIGDIQSQSHRVLFGENDNFIYPKWSKNGEKILLAKNEEFDYNLRNSIVIVNSDGTDKKVINISDLGMTNIRFSNFFWGPSDREIIVEVYKKLPKPKGFSKFPYPPESPNAYKPGSDVKDEVFYIIPQDNPSSFREVPIRPVRDFSSGNAEGSSVVSPSGNLLTGNKLPPDPTNVLPSYDDSLSVFDLAGNIVREDILKDIPHNDRYYSSFDWSKDEKALAVEARDGIWVIRDGKASKILEKAEKPIWNN